MSTKDRLAETLREHGLDEMADLAAKGHYDDFESEIAFPLTKLVIGLRDAGKHELIQRVMKGEFDATASEAEAWFMREGEKLFAQRNHG